MREEGYGHGGSGNRGIGIAMRRARASPQTPTVGAGSSQREDSPAHHSPMPIPCPAVFITTRHAASLHPPRNGRIGLNRRIPKGRPRQKAPSTMPIPCPRAPPTHEPHGFHRDAARRVATNAPSHSRRRPEYTSATRTRRGLALRTEVTTRRPRGMSASRPQGMACGAAPSAAPCAES